MLSQPFRSLRQGRPRWSPGQAGRKAAGLDNTKQRAQKVLLSEGRVSSLDHGQALETQLSKWPNTSTG